AWRSSAAARDLLVTTAASSQRRALTPISNIVRTSRPSAFPRRRYRSPPATERTSKYAMIFQRCDQPGAARRRRPSRHIADLRRPRFPVNRQTTSAALLRQPPSSEGGLRRSTGFGGHPASRFEGVNPAKRLGAKQDGGGGRTRTCEVIRRLIYSQLP